MATTVNGTSSSYIPITHMPLTETPPLPSSSLSLSPPSRIAPEINALASSIIQGCATKYEDYAKKQGISPGEFNFPIEFPRESTEAESNAIIRWWNHKRRTPLYGKIMHNVPIATRGGVTAIKCIQSQAFRLLLQSLGKENTKNSWASHPKFLFGAAIGRTSGGLIGGIAASVELITQIIELKDEISKGRWHEGSIAGFQIFEALGGIGDSIAVTAMGLESIGAVAANTIMWASPLSIVCAFTSLASIPVHLLHINKSKKIASLLGTFKTQTEQASPGFFKGIINRLTNKQEGTFELNPDGLDWLSKELSDPKRDADSFMTRYFGTINREKYASQVKYIINERTEIPQARTKLAQALHNRVTNKITNHKLAILSAIIGIIGVSLVFFAAPLVAGTFSVGLAIIAVSGFISFVRFYREKQATNKLESVINELCPFDRISDEWLEKNAPYGMDLRVGQSRSYQWLAHDNLTWNQSYKAPKIDPIPPEKKSNKSRPKNADQPREFDAVEMVECYKSVFYRHA